MENIKNAVEWINNKWVISKWVIYLKVVLQGKSFFWSWLNWTCWTLNDSHFANLAWSTGCRVTDVKSEKHNVRMTESKWYVINLDRTRTSISHSRSYLWSISARWYDAFVHCHLTSYYRYCHRVLRKLLTPVTQRPLLHGRFAKYLGNPIAWAIAWYTVRPIWHSYSLMDEFRKVKFEIWIR